MSILLIYPGIQGIGFDSFGRGGLQRSLTEPGGWLSQLLPEKTGAWG